MTRRPPAGRAGRCSPPRVLLGGGGRRCRSQRDRAFGTDVPAEQVLYVQSPEVARRLALSFDVLAADVYWIRALQHFGGTPQGDRAGRRTTSCSIRCSTWRPGSTRTSTSPIASARSSCPSRSRAGPAGPTWPMKLLQKGLEASPTKWQYMQDIGFVHFWALTRLQGARPSGSSAAAGCPARPGSSSRSPPTRWRRADSAAPRGTLFQALAESGENDWMRKDAAAPPAAARRDGRAWTSCGSSSRGYRARGGARAGHVAGAGPRRLPARRSRPTRTASSSRSEPWTGDVSLGDGVDAARRCRTSRRRARRPVPRP